MAASEKVRPQNAGSFIELYGDTLYRIALQNMKNAHDAEDIVSDVFIKFFEAGGGFDSPEHEKAWLIRVTINLCRDRLKSALFRRRAEPDALDALSLPPDMREDERIILEAVTALPQRMRDAVYLYYYEGYGTSEIASITGQNKNTVCSLLHRARAALKKSLGADFGKEGDRDD